MTRSRNMPRRSLSKQQQQQFPILWLSVCLVLLLASHRAGYGHGYVSALETRQSETKTTNTNSNANANANRKTQDEPNARYYQRYESYPDYCSDPLAMNTRAIPPLPNADQSLTYKSRLERVKVILRHGARTPIHSKNCWKGHWDEPDGIWDCRLLTTLYTASAPSHAQSQSQSNSQSTNSQSTTSQASHPPFWVEKVYDAFQGERRPSPYRNAMNGTCQDGQLIQQGYDQQVRNGQHLRAAYIFKSDSPDDAPDAPDPRLGLFTTSQLAEASAGGNEPSYFLEGLVRYRSDDDQRTLASGQVLLASLFQPEVEAYTQQTAGRLPVLAHHTADKARDILSSRRGTSTCPHQRAVMERAWASPEYRAFVQAEESQTMRRLIDAELEPEGVVFGGLDCMMTSMCTDRGLPPVLADYRRRPNVDATTTASSSNTTTANASNETVPTTPSNEDKEEEDPYTKLYGPNRFERLMNYVIQNKTFVSRFNDSELSKMDMGPLWAEILDEQHEEPFSVFSGHDSTIFPLMASLGERVWNASDFPAYASMMLIEFHQVIDKTTSKPPREFPSGKAFRLVYNGQVLTWLMEGCPEYSHLCDLSVFRKRVSPFATRKHHGCGVEEGGESEPSSGGLATGAKSKMLSASGSLWMGAMLLSFCVGSLVTGLVMTCCRCQPRRRQRDQSQLVSSTGGLEASSPDSFSDEPDVVIQ